MRTFLHKIFIWSFNLLVLFYVTACSNTGEYPYGNRSKNIEIDTTNAFGEREHFYRHPEKGSKEGSFKRWSKSGKLLEEALFTDGQLDQMRVLYYENGDTQIIENYQKGLFQGKYQTFYQSGKPQLIGQYQNNKMEGVWIRYYENGIVMEKVHFSNNLENGPFQEFYPNGNLKTEGAYRNGDNEHGQLKMYDESGRHIKSMECLDGICKTVWNNSR